MNKNIVRNSQTALIKAQRVFISIELIKCLVSNHASLSQETVHILLTHFSSEFVPMLQKGLFINSNMPHKPISNKDGNDCWMVHRHHYLRHYLPTCISFLSVLLSENIFNQNF